MSVALPVIGASIGFGFADEARSGPGGAPIDCAILLCMGGGFPASPACTAAKAEVVRRVTPNPHSEPPLQIWNCPISAQFVPSAGGLPPARLLWAGEKDWVPEGQSNAEPILVSSLDSDASTQAFLGSVRVYNIRRYSFAWQGRDGECTERWSMQLGSYAADGRYRWSGLHPADVPDWAGLTRSCSPSSTYRGVAFEWTDYTGQKGTEVVHY
ncbi:hypothetical protein [Roseobacter litoralis]|uniref:hypothetical protein n=1 Tax=Roseobacter litoralis TaxID=42443 RepID=UPI0024946290|nr:hypothetical protein [Roseobacter litoralis]